MEITLLHVADCPNLSLARDRVTAAAKQAGVHVTVSERLVSNSSGAIELAFTGSPTILVDGHDPFATADATPSMACRLYATSGGMQGAPTLEELVKVLRTRARKQPAPCVPPRK